MKNIVNIINFGAESNSENLQTDKVQAAIDSCYLKGGGEVVIPTGTYLVGDIRLRSNITLHLMDNAKLLGSRNPEDYFNHRNDKIQPLLEKQITDAPYIHLNTIHGETEYIVNNPNYRFKRIPASRWNNAIVRAIDAENISIIGEKGSSIDGNNCFDANGEELFRGPHAITFFNCTNINLKGYRVENSGNWAHNLLFCENIDASNLVVEAGHDGFDAAVCKNLNIRSCEFYTGDDCVAGYANVNVYVTDCVFNSSCSAMRFGGTNVLVEKCRIYGPGKYGFRGALSDEDKANSVSSPLGAGRNNMLSLFTYYADYSLPIEHEPGNIVITDCVVENVDRFLHYNYSGNETWQKNRPLNNIKFKNINASNISMPLTAYGDEKNPVTVEFENVDMTFKPGSENVTFMYACYYNKISLKNVSIANNNSNPLIKTWSEGKIEIENLKCEAKDKNYVGKAREGFECIPI